MAVQVKFDKKHTRAEALALASQQPGTIFFTTDNSNHQIIIGGVAYGDTSRNVVESNAPIYNSLVDFNKPTASGGQGGESSITGQAYLAQLFEKKEGDFYIYEKFIATSTNVSPSVDRYEYTAYVCVATPNISRTGSEGSYVYHLGAVGETSTDADFGVWKALDGNYDARNVFLHDDIKMAGNYTQVGNKTKGAADVITFATKGLSVKDVFDQIFTKVEWPAVCTYTTIIDGPEASAASEPNLQELFVYGKQSEDGNVERLTGTKLIPVGSTVYIGGSSSYNTINGRKITYTTQDKSGSITPTTWTAAPSGGTRVNLPSTNWGYSLYESGTPKVTSNINSGWIPSGANKFTFVYTRNGGAGSLTLSVGEGIGSFIADSATSATWDVGAAAGAHTIGGGIISSASLGVATITLTKEDNDGYTRSNVTGTPTSLVTADIPQYYEISNLGTTDGSRMTNAVGSKAITDTNTSVIMSNTTESKSVTLKAVYPFRHNGEEKIGVIPADSEVASSTWTQAVSGTALSGHVSTLMDTTVSGNKVYYIAYPSQSNPSRARYIDVPMYDDTHVLNVIAVARNFGGEWVQGVGLTPALDSVAPEGYIRYTLAGSGDDGPQVIKITLSR